MFLTVRALVASTLFASLLAVAPMTSAATEAPPSSTTSTTQPTTSTTQATTSTTTPSSSTSTSSTSTSTPGDDGGEDATEGSGTCVSPVIEDSAAADGEVVDPCVPLHDLDGDGELDEVTEDIDPGIGEQSDPVTPPPIDGPISDLTGGDEDWMGAPLVFGSAEEAQQRVAEAEQDLADAIALVRGLRLRAKSLDAERADLTEAIEANRADREAADERLRLRALSGFVDGAGPTLDVASSYDDILRAQAQHSVVEMVFDVDQATIAAIESVGVSLQDEQDRHERRIEALAESEVIAEQGVEVARAEVEQAERELEAFEAGSAIYIEGVVYPIQWPYSLPLIDSWGFPRMTGTADSHAHQGIDLFAPAGTPLLAAESGYITRIGTGRLGGNKLWLKGSSGADWYYAHLSGFASNISEGQYVPAGAIIGYVGNTGNAVGTPPHLHLEIHPNGGGPVNPYPLMNLISERERALATEAEQ